ncbi:MAG: glycosyltransferase family 4 protein [Gemmataceae bacterium]
MMYLLLILACSFMLSLALHPLVRPLACRLGLLDRPDGLRKIHAQPVPLVGGIVVFLTISLTLAGFFALSAELRQAFDQSSVSLLALFGAAVVICAVGAIDDRVGLRGRYKLAGQLLAVGVLLASGVTVEAFDLFGWHVQLGILALPFTAFWLLGSINSLNLIDGMDGMLGSVGAILALTIAALAGFAGHSDMALLAMALVGALGGFLCFNLPPAKVYLGDCGSMLIGLLIGVMALQSALKGPTTVMICLPVALLTLPIFDSAAAIARRSLTGRSIYTTDRGHLQHCLQRSGLSNRRVLLLVASLCLVTGLGTLASLALQRQVLAVASALAVIGMLTVSRLFGYAELLLVKKHIVALLLQLRHAQDRARTHETFVRLQGSADWQELWQSVTETADQLNLLSVRLNVNIPAIHEGYHARWDRILSPAETNQIWKADIPLALRNQLVGRLEFTGLVDRNAVWEKIAILSKVAEDIEQSVELLTDSFRAGAPPEPVLVAPVARLDPAQTA